MRTDLILSFPLRLPAQINDSRLLSHRSEIEPDTKHHLTNVLESASGPHKYKKVLLWYEHHLEWAVFEIHSHTKSIDDFNKVIFLFFVRHFKIR